MATPVMSHDTRYHKMTDCECQTDDYDPSGDDSDFEGISEPPILRQLKNILDQYPDGSQIIRELVQNAEDAGAKDFKIFFSEVTTDTKATGSYGKYFRGPALCVYNDGVFTEEDWIGIKSIYTSVKEKDALKVGRFGLGFKSVFHITDSPVIISRDRLLVISPLEKPHRICHTIPFSKLWSIKYKATWSSLKECLQNNGNEIFHFSESSVKEQNYPHTLFWFPLRREQSDLSCKMYTKDKMEELFHSFETEASTILLFLKYVSKITIYDKELNPKFEVQMQGKENTDISESRLYIKNNLTGHDIPQFSLFSAYRAFLKMTNADSRGCVEEEWQIVNYFQGKNDMSEKMLELSHDKILGYSPYVGVAFPVSKHSSQNFVGHVFCFLPLPIEPDGKSLTNLPVHVNGFFALSPNRRHILWASHDQHKEDDNRLIWNELMIEKILPSAYIKLVETLLEDENKRAGDIYRCLPDPKLTDSKWRSLLIPLFQKVFLLDIFHAENRNSLCRKWIPLDDSIFFLFEKESVSKETEETLLSLMLDYSEQLVQLPQHLKEAVQCPKYLTGNRNACTINVKLITNLLRKNAKYREYPRHDKCILFQYLLENTSASDFEDLELVPTDDFSYFVSLAMKSDPIYLCDKDTAKLFLDIKQSILSNVPEMVRTFLTDMSKTGTYGVKEFASEYFPVLLERSVQKQSLFNGQHTFALEKDIYDFSCWFKCVWMYLCENKEMVNTIKHLPILPEIESRESKQVSRIHSIEGTYVLMEYQDENLPGHVGRVLESLGVTLLSFIPEYVQIGLHMVEQYLHLPSYKGIYSAIEQILETVEEAEQLFQFHLLPDDVRKYFAVYMSRDANTGRSSIVTNFLRKLKMFPASYGKMEMKLYSIDEVQRISWYNSELFPVRFPCLLLDRNFEGISLAQKLGCFYQDDKEMVEKVLLMIVKGQEYSSTEVECFMKYFTNEFDHFAFENKFLAKDVKFITCDDEIKRSSNEIFDISCVELCELFIGEINRFPMDKEWAKMYSRELIHMGCKTWNHITVKDLQSTLTAFDNSQHLMCQKERRIKGSAIAKCINRLQHSIQDTYCFYNTLRNFSWIPIRKSKPDGYPMELNWFGMDISVEYCRPNEVFHRKFEMLVGSIVPIADDTELDTVIVESLITSEPAVSAVVQQLKKLSETYQGSPNVSEFLRMIECLYEFLFSKRNSENLHAWLANENIVWTGSRFTKPENIYLNLERKGRERKTELMLEPYRYRLDTMWKDYKDLFLCLGSKDTLTIIEVISITKEIQNHHNDMNQEDDIEHDMDLMLHILNFLDEISETLSIEDKRLIYFPIQTRDSTMKLLPSQECTCSENVGVDEEEESCHDSDDEEEFYFIHRKISNHVAESLGVSSLARRIIENRSVEDMEMEQFGQAEPLTTRIRNLIEEYPDGLSVVKEMLQNADDAGATCMRILYDERTNDDAKGGLINKGMAECQGPAVWFYNDEEFKEKDFKNIRKLGGRTKETEVMKIGRFGLGFCSVYNLTDVPSILSGTSLVIFDPRTIHLGKALKDLSNPGLRFDTSNPKILKRMKKQFKPYNGIFGCDLGFDGTKSAYKGTLIRLPLRSVKQAEDMENSISSRPYGRDDVVRFLEKIKESARNLLLFTENVSRIELYHIKSDEDLSNMTPFYKIERKNDFSNLVNENNKQCLKEQLQTHKFPKESIWTAYTRIFTITDLKSNESLKEKWQMVNYFKGENEMSESMLELFRNKAITYAPYVGLAYPLSSHSIENFRGHIFCFLPLPVETEGKSLTDLPVHVNGFFCLSANRRHLLWATGDQLKTDNIGLIWNELLIGDILSSAYIKLVETLLNNEDKEANKFYKCLPDPNYIDLRWDSLLTSLYQNIFSLNMFCAENIQCNNTKWVKFDESVFFQFEKELVSQETQETLFEVLLDYSQNVIQLPEHLNKAIHTDKYLTDGRQPQTVNADFIICLLGSEPIYKDYSRQKRIAVLQYLLENANPDDFVDIELIPTDDVAFFTTLRKGPEPVYLCEENAAELFLDIDRLLLSDISEVMKALLQNLAKSGKYALEMFSSDVFPKLLERSVLPKQDSPVKLESLTSGNGYYTWLQTVWAYLLDKPDLIERVEHLCILPEIKCENSKNVMHTFPLRGIYLLSRYREHQLTEYIIGALKSLGITVILFLPDYLLNCMHVLEKYLSLPTYSGIHRALEKVHLRSNDRDLVLQFNNLSVEVRQEFAIHLSRDTAVDRLDNLSDLLRKFEMFPASGRNSEQRLYSAEGAHAISTEKLENFPVPFPYVLIDHTFNGIRLAEMLHCDYQDEENMVAYVLPLIVKHDGYNSEEVDRFMSYFTSEYEHFSFSEKDKALDVKFIECDDDIKRSCREVFDVLCPDLKDLFHGEDSRFPKNKEWAKKNARNLNLMGCKSFEDVTYLDLEITLSVFNRMSDLDESRCKKATAIKKCINTLYSENKLDTSYLHKLKDFAWVLIQKSKPEMYAKEMNWYGLNTTIEFWRPSEVYCRKCEMLVGSVAPIADETDLDANLIANMFNTEPSAAQVVNQLKLLARAYAGSSNASEFLHMLNCIYRFLFDRIHSSQVLNSLSNEDIVWTGSRFTKPQNIYIDFSGHKSSMFLEPYRFRLDAMWSAYKDLFLFLGAKQSLNISDMISITKEIRNCYQKGEQHEDVDSDMNLLSNILNCLDEYSHSLSEEDKQNIYFPIQTKDLTLKLLPLEECTYSDEIKNIDDDENDGLEEEEEEFNFIHRKISSLVASSLGVPSLTRRIIETKGVEDMEMEQFGQAEPLTTRIKNLIEEYPDGLSVVKEMLQNADDAGATCMRILYDERTNEDAKIGLINKGMAECQGPALWFYNNALFEEKDFKNIRKLGGRTKETELTKIGKFGLGFCSVYNVTDVPSILSGKSLVIFDPRTNHLGTALKDKANPGLRFDVSSPKTLKRLKKQFKPYNGIFGCSLSYETTVSPFKGTLIRLPLRSAKQAEDTENIISSKAYGKEDVLRFLEKVKDSARHLLLFTQNVSTVELYHIKSDEDLQNNNPFYTVERKIEISSQLEENEKQTLNKQFCSPHSPFPNESVWSAYTAVISMRNLESRESSEEKWQIVNYFQGENEMPEDILEIVGGKSIGYAPYVGVAYPLNLQPFFKGHVFCFLPLPIEADGKSLTNLPVHVNGFFCLSANRRHLLWPSNDQHREEDIRLVWNRSMIRDILSSAYIKLVETMLNKESKLASEFYSSLPDPKSIDPKWEELLISLYRNIFALPMFQTTSKDPGDEKWVTFEDAIFVLFEEEQVSEETQKILLDLMLDYSQNVVHLPQHMMEVVQMDSYMTEGRKARKINASYILGLISGSAIYKSYSRDKKMVILQYLLENLDPDEVQDIELIPTDDIQYFPTLRKTMKSVYICDRKTRNLFFHIEDLLLSEVPQSLKALLMKLANTGNYAIKNYSLNDFPRLLEKSVQASSLGRDGCSTWLRNVWTFLLDDQKLIEKVEHLSILPVLQDENSLEDIHTYPVQGTYLLVQYQDDKIPEKVSKGLKSLDVTPLPSLPGYLQKCLNVLEKYISLPTCTGIYKSLERSIQTREENDIILNFQELPDDIRMYFAIYLSKDINVNIPPRVIQFLQKLDMFPATNKISTWNLYSVSDVDTISTEKLELIPIPYPYVLIDHKFEGVPLAKKLHCIHQDEEELIALLLAKIVRNEYRDTEIESFMQYLTAEYDRLQFQEKAIALDVKFIVCDDDVKRSSNQIFDFSCPYLRDIFHGERNRFPRNKEWAHAYARNLVLMGCKSFKDITFQDLESTLFTFHHISIFDEDTKNKTKAIKMCINRLEKENALCETCYNKLRNCAWIEIRKNKPDAYPTDMEWYGTNTTEVFCRPVDLFHKQFEMLIGSVAPIADETGLDDSVIKNILKREPSTDLVVIQLKMLSITYDGPSKTSEFLKMLECIYDFLSSRSHFDDSLTSLSKENIIWTGSCFTNPGKIYLNVTAEKSTILTEPYRFKINPMWTDNAEYKDLFLRLGSKTTLETTDIISITREIRDHHAKHVKEEDVMRDTNLLLTILNFLHEISKSLSDEDKHCIYFPIHTKGNMLKLLLSEECTYSDDIRETEDEEDINEDSVDIELNFIHRKISHHVAASLGVTPLARRIIEGQGIEDMAMVQFGQQESLPMRIRNLIEEYPEGLSVFKEMLQNADDAGARCMRILYDERSNDDAKVGLIDKGMADCQGPALWFYNDALFAESDFENIVQLGGRTKESQLAKIGKFGLGFCSVYNVTDVPSIVSGNTLVIFDPRTIHLGKALKDKSNPGLRFNLSKAQKQARLKRTFKPFNYVFGCNLSCEENFSYKGTLMRLPLRSATEVFTENTISAKQYKREDVLLLLQKFIESAGNLLLFTQNVSTIELYHVQTDEGLFNVKPFYSASREVEKCGDNEQGNMNFLLMAEKFIALSHETRPEEKVMRCTICIEVDEKKISELYPSVSEVLSSTTEWCVSWSIGMSQIQRASKKGQLPLGSCALPLSFKLHTGICEDKEAPYGFYSTGHVFCFLPLPQVCHLPVHINGCFAVESSRKRIVEFSCENTNSDDAEWNKVQMTGTICSSYLNLLENNPSDLTPYYEHWPLFGDYMMFNTLVTSFYQEVVRSHHSLFYFEGKNYKFSECVFLHPSLRYDKDLGNEALLCLREINELSPQHHVMDLPSNVFDQFIRADCQNNVEEKFIQEEQFYLTSFIPSLSTNRWSGRTLVEKRNALILRALKSKSTNVIREMENVACIPTLPNGILRKPSELVYRHSRIASLFFEEDERFSLAMFINDENVLKILMDLGMMTNQMSDEMLLERIHSVGFDYSSMKLKMLQRCHLLLEYLQIDENQTKHLSIRHEMQNCKFLLVAGKPPDWPVKWFDNQCNLESPKNICTFNSRFLVGSVISVLDENIRCSDSVLEYLGVQTIFSVECSLVMAQMSKITEYNSLQMDTQQFEILWAICQSLYGFFNRHMQTSIEGLDELKSLPCIITKDCGLVKPSSCSLELKENLPPYLYKIDDEIRKYSMFLENVGVVKTFTKEFLTQVLHDVSFCENVQTENVETVVKLYNMLAERMSSCPELTLNFLPDDNGCMRKTWDLCFDDNSNRLQNNDFTFVHPDLSQRVLKLFGIKSKSAQYIKQFSHAISFGQTEKLVTRLKGIIRDYPCSVSILHEFVQNADDAEATEVHFIHDYRTHSEDGLFDESLKPLQGPALVVFNNSSFTQKDIEGISSLGEGSKGTDPMKTGQFGIGFNSVYHLTDVPSFLTIGENTPNGGALIMFDPHCKYVPLANEHHPGMMINNVDCIREKYPGTYKTYLPDKVPESSGTWFRFPLRTEEMANVSQISNSAIQNKDIEDWFHSFESIIPKALLFLTNVKSVKLSRIKEDGHIYEIANVHASVSESARSTLQKFNREASDLVQTLQAETSYLGRKGFSHQYQVQLKVMHGTNVYEESWCISQACGVMQERTVNCNLEEGFRKRSICLSPRGGVAARMDKNLKTEESHAFSFLPLPTKTGLPVHVNGHFSLDSSRTNIWKDADGDITLKGIWNDFILSEVIPFAYIRLFSFIQQIIFSENDSLHIKNLQTYNHAFPILDLNEGDIWKTVTKQVYNLAFENEIDLFPIHLDGTLCLSISEKESILLRNITSVDSNGTKVSFVPLAQHDHKFPAFYIDENRKVNASSNKKYRSSFSTAKRERFWNIEDLSSILKKLGLKLLDCPPNVIKSAREALKKSFPMKLTKVNVISFLKSWNSKTVDKCRIKNIGQNISKTVFQSVENVKILLDYCFSKGKYLKEMNGTPLLVQNDDILKCFSTLEKKISSQFCDLLPYSAKHFVHTNLVEILEPHLENIEDVASTLTIESFEAYLHENVPKTLLNDSPIDWEFNDSSTPDEAWFIRTWKFLASLTTKEDTAVLCREYLSEWCLIPAVPRFGKCIQLYPFCYAFAVLDLQSFQTNEINQNLNSIFSKLHFPVPWITQRQIAYTLKEKELLGIVCASYDTPENVLKCIVYHKEKIMFDMNSSQIVLEYLWKNLETRTEMFDTLRSAVLFPNFDGLLTDLQTTDVVCMKKGDIPAEGVNRLCESISLSILQFSPYLYSMYQALNINIFSAVQFYMTFFLPHGGVLDHRSRMIHMNFINDKKIYRNEEHVEDFKRRIENFAFVKNEETGEIQRACDFFTPFSELCRLMCRKQDLLPLNPFFDKKWEDFMTFAGLRTKIPLGVLLEFGRDIQQSMEFENIQTLKQKSKLLIKEISEYPYLHLQEPFLRQFRNIECIVSYKVKKSFTDITPQYSNGKKLISLHKSVFKKHWKCVWSCCKILPKYCEIEDERVSQLLGIQNTPTQTDLISHIHKVCFSLQKTGKQKTNLELHGVEEIKILMESFYRMLELVVHNSHNVSAIKDGLCETPFIHNIKHNLFLRFDQTAIDMQVADEIVPYLCRSSEQYGKFFELFRKLGVTNQIQVHHYTRFFDLLQCKTKCKTLMPVELKQTEQALEGFINCLQVSNKSHLTALNIFENIYLPTHRNTLAKSSEIVICDRPHYRERIGDSQNFLYFKSPERLVNAGEALMSLPERFKPRYLSEIVTEEVSHKDDLCHPNDFIQLLNSKFSMNLFIGSIEALLCLKHKELTSSQVEKFKENMRNVRFVGVSSLKTILVQESQRLEHTEKERNFFLQEVNFQPTVYIKIQPGKDVRAHVLRFASRLFSVITKCTSGLAEDIKDHVMYLILHDDSEDMKQYISHVVNMKITVEDSWSPRLGSYVPLDLHDYLDNTIVNFENGEIVAFEVFDPTIDGDPDSKLVDSEFVYVKIIGKITQDCVFSVYKLYDGTEERDVSSIKLYRFNRGEGEDSKELEVYTDGRANASELRKDPIFLEIKNTLIAAWKSSTCPADKKRIVKRLELCWHPDKNGQNEEFAKEVTQFIFDMIRRLNNGEFQQHQSPYYHERMQEDISQHMYGPSQTAFNDKWFDQVNECVNSRMSRRGNRHDNTNVRKPNPQPHVGSRWMKQARLDLIAARQQMKSFRDLTLMLEDDETSKRELEKSKLTMNWICYKCHQAIEKALKSVLYTSDADNADRMSKTHDLVSLSLLLKIPEVSAQCRRFPNEVSLLHTNMRYPVNSDSQVPGEKFTVEHANKALEIAECILEECENAP